MKAYSHIFMRFMRSIHEGSPDLMNVAEGYEMEVNPAIATNILDKLAFEQL